ncbi:MAG: NAD(P)H-hydrate epimerase, partial [bacterium]
MRLPTSQEMAALDRRAAEEFGVPTLLLMEAAGRQVAEVAARMMGSGTPRVIIVAGKGNNGGDALVAARVMTAAGWRATVVLLARDADVEGDAAINLQAARRAGVDISNLDT